MKDEEILLEKAKILFERAYRRQMKGEYGFAIQFYERSLDVYPTPEAYTFLGWTYSMLDRYEEAIEMCQDAIALDPEFGNPYNDIGAYLIELGRYEEAIPWLKKATAASRYDAPQFPYLNLGRVHEKLGDTAAALASYQQALAIDPLYLPAVWARHLLLGKLS